MVLGRIPIFGEPAGIITNGPWPTLIKKFGFCTRVSRSGRSLRVRSRELGELAVSGESRNRMPQLVTAFTAASGSLHGIAERIK